MLYPRAMKLTARGVSLFVGDALCIAVSIVLAAILRLALSDGLIYLREHMLSLTGSALIFLVVFYIAGMYERQVLVHKKSTFATTFISVGVSLILIILVFYAKFELHIGRGILALAAIFITFTAWGLRTFYTLAAGYGLFTKNTLIVGRREEAESIIQRLSRTEDSGYKVFGIVSSRAHQPGEFISGYPVLGHLESLREFVSVYDIETIIVASSVTREKALLRILRPLRYAGVQILDYVSLWEELAQEIPLDYIDDEWLMHAAMNSSRIHIRKMKRIMDIGVASVGLVLSAPICLVTSILIKFDSRGTVFYRQTRSGLDNKPYTVIKFRTMKQDAEQASGAVWANQTDSRVTRVGYYLRKSRIDEIPQLLNVLKGEMSLVGPRPERPEFIETLSEAIPFYKERLLVPPGVTGWAQVKYPYAASIDAARRKLQYDLYYIKHMSFFLDCLILLRTFKTIIVGLRHSEALLPEEKEPDDLLSVVPAKPEPHKSNHPA